MTTPGLVAGRDLGSAVAETGIEQLRRHVELLLEAQRIAHLGSWSWDVDTDEMVWSDEHYRIFGVEPETFTPSYEAMLPFLHEDDLVRVRRSFEQALLTGEPLSYVARIRCPAGEVRWIESNAASSIVNGRVVAMVGTVLDVTDGKAAEMALRESEQRFRGLVQHASDVVLVLDVTGSISYVSPSAERLFSMRAEDLMGRNGAMLVHPDDLPTTLGCFALIAGDPGSSTRAEYRVVLADGEHRYVETAFTNLLHEPAVAGFVLNSRDVTERTESDARLRAHEDELRQSQRQLNAAQRLSSTGSWDRDLRTGAMRWSDEFLRILGFEPETQPSVERLVATCHPDDRDRFTRLQERAFANGRDAGEFRVVRPDGNVRVLQVVIEVESDDEGVPVRVTGTAQEITERKELEETLKRQALHDMLTDLPNRTLFMDRVEHALRRAGRTGESIAVLFVDLDDFKTVNDSLGHSAGDEILVEAGRRLLANLRPGDTVARLGGDEFAVLLEAADQAVAESAAARVLAALERPLSTREREIVVHASVGIAVASDDIHPEELLRNADAAMYAAKRRVTKDRYRVFEPSMHAAAHRRLELRAQLQTAVERGEFEVFYQPLVRLDTEAVVGVEALVRWAHPERGLVSPAEFIPLAEESGLIVPIGSQVLRAATFWVQRVNRARRGQPLHLSVNLSPRQLLEPDFLQVVDDALRGSGLDPARLALEITETVLVREEETVVPLLSRLRQRGMKVAVDGFGTGYSSLSYLRHLPIDVLKIDRAFVNDIAHSSEDRAVAQAVVKLAQVLGHSTVAEGIETPEQADALREIGCSYGQGYLFSRPLPGPELEEMLLAPEAAGSLVAGEPSRLVSVAV